MITNYTIMVRHARAMARIASTKHAAEYLRQCGVSFERAYRILTGRRPRPSDQQTTAINSETDQV